MRLASVTLIALLVACSSHAAAQTPSSLSFSRADYPASAGPRGIVAADFNRDGAQDLAVSGSGSDSVAILINETGSGRGFRKAHDIVVGGGPFDIAAGDLNNDNIMDLVVANADGNSIDILRGRADGSFLPPVHKGAVGNPRGVAVGDMNGDGKLDIVYTQYNFDRVQVLHGDGSGWNFVAVQGAATAGDQPQAVVVADFNRDWRLDIAVANTGASLLTVLYQTDGETFHRVEIPGQQYFNVLVASDFNGDGWSDIAAASTPRNVMAVYLSRPDGLSYSSSYATGASPRGIATADINKDGRLDLVTANRGANSVSIFVARADPAGLFWNAFAVAAGTGSRDVVVADFGFDGYPDIATANEYGSSASVLMNNAAPPATLFWRAVGLPPLYPGSFARVGDFNKNGKLDVVTTGGVTLDGAAFVPLSSGRTEYRYSSDAAIADFNNDGHPDVALPSRYYGETTTTTVIEVFHGDGAGAFRLGATLPIEYPFALRASDLDMDGRLDLVLLGWNSGTQHDSVQLFAGSPSGFQEPVTIELPTYARGLDIADVNRDGKPDLLLAIAGSTGGAYIAYGDGTGTFPTSRTLPAAQGQVQIEAADINHDGALDILTADYNSMNIWLAAPDGEFATEPTATYSGSGSERFAVGDFNADGHLDLLTPGRGLLPGRGDGTFGEAQSVNATWEAAVPADYDGDGRMDAVTVSWEQVLVLLSRTTRGQNLPPIAATGGGTATVRYEWQYEDDIEFGAAGSYDPNLDSLVYEWQDPGGRIISTSSWFTFERREPGTYRFKLTVRDGHGGEDTEYLTVTVLPVKEIVRHVVDWSVNGAWQAVSDPTAANELRAWYPNRNAPKLAAPLTAPTSYVDLYVVSDTTQWFNMWMRLKAENDSWANDSVFVQFSDGVITPDGRVRYRMGTTDALAINLEQCSGCGVAGWGWRDERWGTTLNSTPVLFRFPRSGGHVVRIQSREDGVSFDQLVLSAERYRTAAPGSAKRDATILPEYPLW